MSATPSKKPGRHNLNCCSGFTLTELVITLALGLVILAGASQLFFRVKETAVTLDENYQINANERRVFDYFQTSVSQAGYFGCAESLGLDMTDYRETSSSTTNQGITKFNKAGLIGIDGKTDEIQVFRTNNEDAITLVEGSQENGDSFVLSSGHAVSEDSWIVISDCIHSEIVHVNNVEGNKVGIDQCGTCDSIFQAGSKIYRLNGQRFYIDENSDDQSALYVKVLGEFGVRKLLDNVGDLQILYGVDTDKDIVPNRYMTADEVSSLCGLDNSNNCWQQVTSVRIEMMSSSYPVSGSELNGNSGVEPETSSQGRTIIKTIALRNR